MIKSITEKDTKNEKSLYYSIFSYNNQISALMNYILSV